MFQPQSCCFLSLLLKLFSEVENSTWCQSILEARMAEGHLHKGQILGDITDFTPTGSLQDGIDGIVGGFPCQVVWNNEIEVFSLRLLGFKYKL